nr:sensor histidine kinase [Auraticoccus cholistanensis]
MRQFHPLLPPREPAPENAWSRDLLITLVAFVLCFAIGAADGLGTGLVAALITLPLVVRRHHPMLMLYGCALAALPQLLLPNIQFSVVVVPFVVYNVARWVEPSASARLSVVIGLLGSVLGPLAWTAGYGVLSQGPDLALYCISCMTTVLIAYVIGRRRHEAIRSTQERRVAEETTLRMQLAATEQRARAAEVNERNRIARELHDIVAHSLSVIVVQAEGGRALAAKRPELAADVLDTIAETSRESLVEMRRIVGVLRNGPDGGPTDWKPAPGLADIADLVSRTTDRARLEVRGALPAVGQTLGLTVYRVVQEALTNMLKHGGPDARAQVVLDCTQPGVVHVSVVDDGRGSATGSDGQGNGLRGMNERVQLVGGRLLARPRPSGGFEVRASFPTGAPRPPAPQRSPARTTELGTPPRPEWAAPARPAPPVPRPPISAGERAPGWPAGADRPPAVRPPAPAALPSSTARPQPPPRPTPPRPTPARPRPTPDEEPTVSLDTQPTVRLDLDSQPTQVLPTVRDDPRPDQRGRP